MKKKSVVLKSILLIGLAILGGILFSVEKGFAQSDDRKPVYAIAHHVITVEGVQAAAKHGANALEVDVSAWPSKGGWFADHDNMTIWQAGDRLEAVLQTIVDEKKAGAPFNFVWLDIKNPDYVKDQTNPASMSAPRKAARDYLEANGIYVLYGFYSGIKNSTAFKETQADIQPMEAISLSGKANTVLNEFTTYAPNLPAEKRVVDNGLFMIELFFNCTLKELQQAANLRNNQVISNTFAWTITNNQSYYVDKLFGQADVNGIIYGYRNKRYDDSKRNVQAFDSLANWVSAHPETHRFATDEDIPW